MRTYNQKSKTDILILLESGHFYFALTDIKRKKLLDILKYRMKT